MSTNTILPHGGIDVNRAAYEANQQAVEPEALLDLVLTRLSAWGPTRTAASGWTSAYCPAHDDRRRSLSLIDGNTHIVFRCHAGCMPGDVATALDFTLADLAYDTPQALERLNEWQPDAATQTRAAASRERAKRPLPRVIDRPHYDLHTPEGVLLARHRRVTYEDGSKSMYWEAADLLCREQHERAAAGDEQAQAAFQSLAKQGKMDTRFSLFGRAVSELPLWNVHDVMKGVKNLAAAGGESLPPIILTEGEKAALALVTVRLLAVGTVTGASETPSVEALWPLADAATVYGHELWLWRDNDEPGHRHMERIAARLAGELGVPLHLIRLVDWQGAPPKGDAADYVTATTCAEDVLALPAQPADGPAAGGGGGGGEDPPSNGGGDQQDPPGNGGGTGDQQTDPPDDPLEQLLAALTASEDVAVVFREVAQLAALGAAEYGRAKTVLKAHFGKGLNLNDLDKAVNEARRTQAHTSLDDDGGLPQIVTNGRPLRNVTADAMHRLTEANDPPLLFVRSGALVRTRADEDGRPIIDGVSNPILRGRLARVANFIRETEQGPMHVPPPQDVVADVLALGDWRFPGLVGITEVPVLRPDGSLVTTPGYDRTTRLIYRPAPGLTIPDVPENPSAEQVGEALALIWEAIGEFPYVDPASRANALALLETPVLRAAIAGPVPLGLVDAPKMGTGKGLLADAIALVATGRTAAIMTAPREEDEWRKRITSVLASGATVIGIDNVVDRLASPSLAAVLTAMIWTDRLLGQSTMLALPQRATWLATGNNIRLGGDIPRRCYWIRLDAKMAQPWRRGGFTHPNLLDWVGQHRGELLAALLTLARAWFAAGKPLAANTPVLGSFPAWASTLAGVLAHAGIVGFLDNLDDLYNSADEETPQWEAFLTAWHTLYGGEAKTTAEVVADLTSETLDQRRRALRDALPDTLATALTSKITNLGVRLGKALANQVDARYGERNLRLTKAGTEQAREHRGAVRWLVVADPPPPPPPPPDDLPAEDAEDAEDDPAHGADVDTPLEGSEWVLWGGEADLQATNGHARGVSAGLGSAEPSSASSASSASAPLICVCGESNWYRYGSGLRCEHCDRPAPAQAERRVH